MGAEWVPVSFAEAVRLVGMVDTLSADGHTHTLTVAPRRDPSAPFAEEMRVDGAGQAWVRGIYDPRRWRVPKDAP